MERRSVPTPLGLKGGYAAGVKMVESCELLSHLANIGDARSLILHPASTTHRQLTPEQQDAAGAHRSVVRLVIAPDYLPLSSGTVMLQASSMSFDAATFHPGAPGLLLIALVVAFVGFGFALRSDTAAMTIPGVQ
mgnify:CR=1 FL=1